MRLLVVEDEIDLQEAIAEGLKLDGYAVDTCSNGNDAYELLFVENYDLVVLDLNLPGMDGLEVLKRIRSEKPELKILILSARSSVHDKVIGLDTGAHDYLAKPFDFIELEARIRSLLRQKFTSCSNELIHGQICLYVLKHQVLIDGKEITLTKKEFGLLEYLMLNKNRAVSQEELIDHVWDNQSDCFSGAIRVHIATLRKKLKAALLYDPIMTKVGIGYLLIEGNDVSNVT